ncbi:MAG: transposase [Deltaproteobacteria bacterium]|jgi:REP element-mobilizing transposase RayT|nr:transposase [Deltaproteobacteria bacterium]
MHRLARLDAPGALHHLIIRGIERRKIFRDNKDRDNFIDRLSDLLPATQTACYAWDFIPNHAHFLFRSSGEISTLMRRLLTGYAIYFNRRHRRHGQLFQNRYKSILCQEDSYLLELVRYIHLNPLRAGIVKDLRGLNSYPYCGHSCILGKRTNTWQDKDYILKLFASNKAVAIRRYREFVKKGIEQGKRSDLVGGGLIRSAGGWSAIKALRRIGAYQKGDERILGDSDFVEKVLAQAKENFERKYHLKSNGFNFEKVLGRVAELLDLKPEQVLAVGKYKKTVAARSLLCFWATSELGMSQSELGQKLKISQPAVSLSVKRGEQLAIRHNYSLKA